MSTWPGVPSLSGSNKLTDSYLVRNVRSGVRLILDDNLATVALVLFLGIIALGIVGPEITPYEYNETLYDESGQLLDTQSPSLAHPLGTTSNGHDVLSRVMYGARPTVITGLLGGSMIIGIGMTIGVTAGYLGGRVENTLMRFTDFVYGVPLIPFAIVLLSLLGFNFYTSIIVIGAILWRGNARVLRSQVLQIKERPFILSAKATGASSARIVLKHILPNIAPMAFLFFALGIGYAILVQASLAFIGVTNPFVPSWGIMIRNAYNSGLMTVAWWWAITPGILISLTVMSAFVLGRRLEAVSGDGDGQSFAEAG